MKKIIIILVGVFLLFSCNKDVLFYVSNVNVVDVVTGEIIENQMIEIENGVIKSITDNNDLPVDSENIFNGNLMYVSPGLTDMNVYIGKEMTDIKFWQIHPGDRMLAAGVTTIRAGSSFRDPRVLIEFEDALRGNITIGPDIIKPAIANYSSGKNIESLKDEVEDAEADYIKMLNIIPEVEMNNILNYAQEQNIYTCGNVYSFDDFIRCSEIGFDEIPKIAMINILLMDPEFADTIYWFDENDYWPKLDTYFSKYYSLSEEELLREIEPVLSKIIDVMKSKKIAITTALAADEISAMKIQDFEKYLEYAVRYKIPHYIDSINLATKLVYGDYFRLEMIPDCVIFQQKLGRITLRRLKEEAVLLVTGTELSASSWYGLAPGISLHDELRILIECGFNNLEALQTATLNPSIIGERMGLDYRWGRVVNGYKADLIFTDNNPLENLDALREPECVMKSGVLYLKNDLQALR